MTDGMHWVRIDGKNYPPTKAPVIHGKPVDWEQWLGLLWIEKPGDDSHGAHKGRLFVDPNDESGHRSMRWDVDGWQGKFNVTHYCEITPPKD